MRKSLIIIALAFFSNSSMAAQDWGTSCSTIKTIRSWQSGSDLYGLRIELSVPYAGCEAGFYVPHVAENKQYVYSTALTAFTANIRACIQIELVSSSIGELGNLCKLNAITLSK